MRGEREQLGPDEGKLYRPHTPKTSVNVEIPGVCGASASAETLPQMARRGLLPTPPKEIQQVRGVTGAIHAQKAYTHSGLAYHAKFLVVPSSNTTWVSFLAVAG